MQIEHLNKETTDGTVRNLDALYQLFPSCFTEAPDALGKVHRAVDWGKLRELLGEYVEDGEPEKYDFTWVGKRAAQREAAAPCRKTLRPCPEESVDWDTTQNLYIEGDNLEVLKLLQNSYMGKVKMIYIDPPYNTGNDFVYHDDFYDDSYDEHNYNEEGKRLFSRNQVTHDGKLIKNTDSNGRFHSDWCSMIYTRLMVARNLLTEDGVIFISIDDNEVDNLKKISNEVFGEGNFVAQFVWQSTPGSNTGTNVITVTEYILLYARSFSRCIFNTVKVGDEEKYVYKDEYYEKRGGYILNKLDRRMTGVHYSEALNYPIEMPDGSMVYPGSTLKKNNDNWNYRWSKTKVEWGKTNGFLVFKNIEGKWNAYFKQYYKVDNNDNPIERSVPYQNILKLDQFNSTQGTKEIMSIFGKKYFDYPKPSELVKYLLQIITDNESFILDFFSGSASTAHAIMQLNAEDGGNRKFIMVQLQEETAEDSEAYKAGYKNICEIGKERIRRVGKKIKEEHPESKNLDTGFRVLKCDESNYKPVAFAPKDYTQESLDMFLDNINEERTGLDLLFDCMMRWGLELSLPYDTKKVDGCTIYNVDDGNLVACFDGVVTGAVIDAIAETHPLRVVFRDSSFTEAAQKMNLFELFKQKCGWTDQEVQNNVRVI